MVDFKTDALAQVKSAIPEGYIIGDTRFERLNAWTFLLMLLNESERALKLAETYQASDSLDVFERVLLCQALFRTAIINYGKCFASAGSGRISLDGKEIFKGQPDISRHHQRMIAIRNCFAAHNDQNDLDLATLAVRETDDEVTVMHLYTLSTPFSEFPTFREVIEHCSSEVVRRVNKYLNRLEMDLGKPIRLREESTQAG